MKIHRERGSAFLPSRRALKACQGPPSAHWPRGCHCTKGFAHGIPGNALKMQSSGHYPFMLQTRRTEVRESKWLTRATEQVSSLGLQVQSFFFLRIFFFNMDHFFKVLNLLQYCFSFMFWFFGHDPVISYTVGVMPSKERVWWHIEWKRCQF